MSFRATKSSHLAGRQGRMDRARNEGFLRGSREGKLFKLAVGKDFDRQQCLDWLNTVIDEGRSELVDQHAWEREIETWDMACRIAFWVEIT